MSTSTQHENIAIQHASPSEKHRHLPHPKYRPDIDGLRAVAVLSVIAFHAFPDWVKGGFVGVDIFFVISGFLISTIIFTGLQTDDFSFSEFYARRVRRIFPALLLVLTAAYAFGWFALLSDEYKQLGKHTAAGAGFVSNFVLKGEAGYFDNVADTKPLLHLWSLGIEEQFYIVWPLLLWFAWKKRFNLLAICVTVVLISFAINIARVQNHAVSAFYLPQSRFWELIGGSLLAYVALYNPPSIAKIKRILVWGVGAGQIDAALRNIYAFAGVSLIAIAVLAAPQKYFPGWWALLPVVGAILIIAAGAQAWFNRTVLSSRPLVWVGLISYPLYLWHWPLLSFARIVEAQTPSVELRIAIVLITFALAWLTYKFIEKPIRGSEGKSLLLCVLMATVGLVGYGTFKQGGFPFRLGTFEARVQEIKAGEESTEACKSAIPVPGIRYCLLANPKAAPSVAIIGDSHGNRLFYGLSDKYAAAGENLLQLGGGGCLPFWDIETGSIGLPNQCHTQMNPQLDYILNNPNIKTVIFAHRGPLHVEGDDPATQLKYFIKDVANPAAEDNKQIYRQALFKSAAKLKAKGKKVVLVIDAPEFPYDPLACIDLKRPFTSPFTKKPDCRLPKADVEKRNRNYIDITKDVATALELPVINLQDALCDSETCFAVKDNALLYMDPDHLNQHGARYVINHLWDQFH